MMNTGYHNYQKRKELVADAKRIALYSAILFLLTVTESSFLASLWHLPATPDLVLGALAVVSLIDKRENAAITAMIGGVMTDALGGVGIYLSPLIYFGFVLILSLFTKKMMKSYLSWLALLPATLLVRALWTFLGAYIFGGAAAYEILRYAVLPEAVSTAVLCLPLYPLMRLAVKVTRLSDRKDRKGDLEL